VLELPQFVSKAKHVQRISSMNQKALRELFHEMRADMRDYFDAQREMQAAQARIAECIFDVCAEIGNQLFEFDDENVIARTEEVTVVTPPGGLPDHMFTADGKCVAHPNCTAVPPPGLWADCAIHGRLVINPERPVTWKGDCCRNAFVQAGHDVHRLVIARTEVST
jgi:hypothetical protein